MDFLTDPIVWLVLGAIVMLSELIIPGGVVFFLGAACVLVAGSLFVGLIDNWVHALTLFFISSLVLVISLRFVVSQFAEGDSSVANTQEILDEVDELVDVLETIGPVDHAGLVRFRGTQWRAMGNGSVIPAGSRARIVSRDNITLLVEAVEDFETSLNS